MGRHLTKDTDPTKVSLTHVGLNPDSFPDVLKTYTQLHHNLSSGIIEYLLDYWDEEKSKHLKQLTLTDAVILFKDLTRMYLSLISKDGKYGSVVVDDYLADYRNSYTYINCKEFIRLGIYEKTGIKYLDYRELDMMDQYDIRMAVIDVSKEIAESVNSIKNSAKKGEGDDN